MTQRVQTDADAAFIGIRRVREISGFSKATIGRKIKDGKFPAPVIAEGNCTRWDLAEVLAWRADQFKKREQRTALPEGAAMAPA